MNRREIEESLQQLFDGRISSEDARRLEEELERKPEFAELYREYALLHFGLGQRGRIKQLMMPSIDSTPNVRLRLLRSKRRQIVGSIAAAIILSMAAAFFFRAIIIPPYEPMLSIKPAGGSIYELVESPDEDRPGSGEDVVPGSVVKLNQGTLELVFGSGVRGIVTAPATFELEEASTLKLHNGSGWFRVEKGVKDFTVRTRDLEVIDLGTEFGFIASPAQGSEIHVFEGSVEANPLRGHKEGKVLKAGDSRRTTVVGRLDPIEPPETPFATKLPGGMHFLYFPLDSHDSGKVPVRGNHPAVEGMTARLVQTDERSPESRMVAGRFGRAVRFDGVGDVIQSDWKGIYGHGPLTIACWAKIEGEPGYGGFVSWGVSKKLIPVPYQWKFVLSPDLKRIGSNPHARVLRASTGDKSTVSIPLKVDFSGWHHYAMVFSGGGDGEDVGDLNFYLDGEQVASDKALKLFPPFHPVDLDDADSLVIGGALRGEQGSSEPRSMFFNGAIDELFIVEGALGPAEIRSLYSTNSFPGLLTESSQ